MCYSNCKYESWQGECQIGNRSRYPKDADCEMEHAEDELDYEAINYQEVELDYEAKND